MQDTHPQDGFSKQFLDHMHHPRHQGELIDPSGKGRMIGQCGDSISVDIHVTRGRIDDIRVLPAGCAYTLVCSSAMCILAHGKGLDEALRLDSEDIVREVGGLPDDHLHCARLALNALGEAIVDHMERGKRAPE